MQKKLVLGLVIVVLLGLAGVFAQAETAVRADGAFGGGISYASQPDEAALYLNDMVFVRDTVVLPTEAVRVLLPPGTFPDTLILTENDVRVRNYRISPQSGEVYYSQAT
ncbi:MAG: hypothetical protein K8S97_07330, partial [Anaerolineae bacterium]|nr:hypothetical protein [Anaerolineae bacterium]